MTLLQSTTITTTPTASAEAAAAAAAVAQHVVGSNDASITSSSRASFTTWHPYPTTPNSDNSWPVQAPTYNITADNGDIVMSSDANNDDDEEADSAIIRNAREVVQELSRLRQLQIASESEFIGNQQNSGLK